jgi:tRNA pseudouridine synthase B
MTPSPKPQKRKISGVLLLDKAVGISSNTALQQVRRLYRAEKAGHTGVLDPLAGGLLPICFGEAAKFAQYLLDADKAYTAALQLGTATATGDAEGEVVASGRADVSAAEFQAACTALTGAIRQVPPMFSALKHEGRPLYEYARKGIVIERKPRDIVIRRIDIREFAPPHAVIDVSCSKGTYIRTLAEDIAKQLGTYAHLTALRRTASAGFSVDDAHTYEQLATLTEPERDALLLPCDAMLAHLPRLNADADTVRRLACGQSAALPPDSATGFPDIFRQPESLSAHPLRIYAPDGRFAGLAHYVSGSLKALRMMSAAQEM